MSMRMVKSALLGGAFALASTGAVVANGEKPQYGGSLEIGTVYVTLSALSWDGADFNWKHNHDTGLVYEQLFVGDLSKSKKAGGQFNFIPDAWLPTAAIKGELVESWEWKKDPLRVEMKVRKGVVWPEKAGIMKKRDFVAEDIVYSFNRSKSSPKKLLGYYDHVEKVEAPDPHTVVFYMKHFFAEWDYQYGWGYYSGIQPKEVAEAGAQNWKNVNGTGPYLLTDFVSGNSNVYSKNADYWGKETIGGTEYKLPFVDKITYRTIKDEATFITAIRTGKLDMLEAIRWQNVDSLKKSAPQLKWNRWLNQSGTFMAMRVDVDSPFKDIRVRRAMNYAVNKQEIVSAYYNGNAELFAYPQHPDYVGYFEPLDKQPASVQELYKYDPAKAKKLLAEAGFPKGFTTQVQVCSCSPDHMELLPLVAGYLEQVGVKLEIKPLEYGAFLSAMTSKTMTPAYFMNNGHTNPITTIRKSFVTGQQWNPSGWSEKAVDAKIDEIYREEDETKRQKMLRELTTHMLDQAPYIWLPTPYIYSAWWPWVKNYEGELRAGAVRPGPIYSRLWVDQEMKKKMGH